MSKLLKYFQAIPIFTTAQSKSLAAIAARSAIQPSSQTQPMPPYSPEISEKKILPGCPESPDMIEPKWLTATHDGHEIHPLHHFCTTLTPF